jgi:hypothetical protein
MEGLRLPSLLTMTDKTGGFVFQFKELQLNSVEDSLFTPPSNLSGGSP